MNDQLTDTVGVVASAACGAALLAMVLALIALLRLRRVRRAQRAVLGESGIADLTEHAEGLQRSVEAAHTRLDEVAGLLDTRTSTVERRLDGALSYRALVRYDAYNEMSGHQSFSLAMLDAHRNGLVLSAITHRDSARLYVKQLHGGDGETALSPEETEAIRLALTGEGRSRTLD